MDAHDFDRLTRTLSPRMPRRTLAGLLGLTALGVAGSPEAKKKKKKKKKVKRNNFGCVDVGKYCKNSGQCCSGICQGKKKNRKCKAHDQSTCQPGQDTCAGNAVPCTTTTNVAGTCVVTTGKAPYCFFEGDCAPCSKDSDCVPTLGAGAACIVCPECINQTPQGTACVGISPPPV